MKVDSKFAKKIESGDFIVTAEYVPVVSAVASVIETTLKTIGSKPVAINMADNQHGVATSSLAASVIALKTGFEPVLQIVTRDRNRIALQSDLLGAASLGIKNVLCLSGHHQTLTDSPESANVFDMDSTQLIEIFTRMGEKGELVNGGRIEGQFSMLVGAVTNPFLKPLELNVLRLERKIEAGAKFIQTHPVFDVKGFGQWLDAAHKAGITAKTAILAGIFPLETADQAVRLRDKYADFCVTDDVIGRLKSAGNEAAQKKQGLAICAETIKQIKTLSGLRGIHILSSGKEPVVSEILGAAGL